MVYRIYVEKKEELALEAKSLESDLKSLLGIKSIKNLRILNRYDAENISEELFGYAVKTVFSEPQLDITSKTLPESGFDFAFAVEYLPGQFDQRAASAEECIQIISCGERPIVKSAKVYLLSGELSDDEKAAVKKYVINPVEAREASLGEAKTLKAEYKIPDGVEILSDFCDMGDEELEKFIAEKGLAMDLDDIRFCRDYFRGEKRCPTLTEIKMIDTYWSDHCRHTTFLTTIDSASFEDDFLNEAFSDYMETRKALGRTKPVNLMDIATLAVKYLKKEGKLEKLDESEEINACTVKLDVKCGGKTEKWLLLFKNETHNHPTEIEPFGGAATCIGGAIRDPLSGRAYVYAAMRVTGAADPLVPVSETMEGKLPQRKIVTTAAGGYSSYGNQIGLATGIVDEIYHSGYAAKRMEIGAVIGAAPEENVRRERPEKGDVVILLGGKTGRDGCGGATGSSKAHSLSSLETCGAEVQKGNAPEERKLQRLFRNKEATLLIKRCNDFGAGGVSVAVGELADGLKINLDKVPKKYEGLDGTELAISESQERMAVVVAKEDAEKFLSLAKGENLEATQIAEVTDENRLVMFWRDKKIVDLSRDFLNSNGAEKHINIRAKAAENFKKEIPGDFAGGIKALADDLNICSKRALSERFDSTIGAGTVLMPFGGKYQLTPIQAMANEISREKGSSDTCSLMAWGYNPFITEKSPFHGAYLAVVESVSKLVAEGAEFKDVYLTFQEYFEKPKKDPERWGKPMAALLGAFRAQKEFGIAAVGGKDSMSGSFEKLDVPPTLVSFAVTAEDKESIVSPEFKEPGRKIILIAPEYGADGLVKAESQIKVFEKVTRLLREKKAVSAYTLGMGGIAEAVMKMCFGNGIGFDFSDKLSLEDIFAYGYGSFVLEMKSGSDDGIFIGETSNSGKISYKGESVSLAELSGIYEGKLEKVYKFNAPEREDKIPNLEYTRKNIFISTNKFAHPKALIPVFPGTNCEYDTAKAFERAGAKAEIFVINNLSGEDIKESASAFAEKIKNSQIVFIPGGFSGGDEPDGSGKFITAFFRNPEIKDAVSELLEERDGLMGGICNGFQALIKLGLVPYGRIIDTNEDSPTLTFNTIARHQSKIVRTMVTSTKSPWLSKTETGEIYSVPISHGEGRFLADGEYIKRLAQRGQIITQYVDLSGRPTYDIQYNPNGSVYAVEGICSPDGRIIGKMGHSERVGKNLYKNVPGNYEMGLFESAVDYYGM